MSYRDLPPVGDLPFAFQLLRAAGAPHDPEREEMLRLVMLYSEARAQLGAAEAALSNHKAPAAIQQDPLLAEAAAEDAARWYFIEHHVVGLSWQDGEWFCVFAIDDIPFETETANAVTKREAIDHAMHRCRWLLERPAEGDGGGGNVADLMRSEQVEALRELANECARFGCAAPDPEDCKRAGRCTDSVGHSSIITAGGAIFKSGDREVTDQPEQSGCGGNLHQQRRR
jgi:hypothetical protein